MGVASGTASGCTDLFKEISLRTKLSDQQMCRLAWAFQKFYNLIGESSQLTNKLKE